MPFLLSCLINGTVKELSTNANEVDETGNIISEPFSIATLAFTAATDISDFVAAASSVDLSRLTERKSWF